MSVDSVRPVRRTGSTVTALAGSILALAVTLPVHVRAQDPCPSASSADAEAGWEAYQANDMARARERFEEALDRCANDQYARTGLGYVELRAGEEARARALFETVLRREPDNVDALVGMGLVSWRLADLDAVRRYFEETVELVPDHATAVEYLARVRGRAGSVDPGSTDPSDAADTAWREGDTDRAFELYSARLESHPDDGRALHRMALMRAWREEYGRALDLFDRLIAAAPRNLDARVDRARVLAWRSDTGRALEELEAILSEHPDHPGALEAKALFQAWSGRYEESLTSYEQLLSIAPEHGTARRQQARVLAWSSDFEGSRRVYEELLTEDPADIDARLGLARTLAFADRLDEALAQYDMVLDRSPEHVGALQAKARTLAWADRLVDAETLIREALAVDDGRAESYVVLGQILQWQDRQAAARQALERAVALAPTNGDAHDQLRTVELALAPSVRPSSVYESDSDDNRMLTVSTSASWHPLPRLELRADAYRRGLEQAALEQSSFGGTLTGVWVGEPGWRFTAGLGGNVTDAAGRPSEVILRAGARSPSRHRVQAGLDISSQTLDETAALALRGVRFTDLSGNARWTPRPGWRVDGSLGWAHFDGSETNTRIAGSLSASRRIARAFALGFGLRSFGYDKDLDDGYFDPSYYGIFEVTGSWRHVPRPWTFLVEAAPGVQQVTRDGDPNVTARGSARIGYLVGPGQEVSVSYGFSSAGLISFSTGASDYRYSAVIVALSWAF